MLATIISSSTTIIVVAMGLAGQVLSALFHTTQREHTGVLSPDLPLINVCPCREVG